MEIKIIAQAKKKLRNYRIIEEFTSGLELNGQEIKSLRNYQSSIDEAYILPQRGELYIINMHITPYKYSRADDLTRDTRNYNNKRKRKLLLTQKEIKDLIFQAQAKNYVIIPLLLFINSRGWAKLKIALAQHLRKYQIKDKIKEKELKRKINEKDFW